MTSGDRVIAAERGYGNGAVTVVGFDPSTKWIADGNAGESLWRRLLPARTYAGLVLGDDSQLVSAVSQLPVAGPPTDRRTDRLCSARTSCSSVRSTTWSCAAWTGATGRG